MPGLQRSVASTRLRFPTPLPGSRCFGAWALPAARLAAALSRTPVWATSESPPAGTDASWHHALRSGETRAPHSGPSAASCRLPEFPAPDPPGALTVASVSFPGACAKGKSGSFFSTQDPLSELSLETVCEGRMWPPLRDPSGQCSLNLWEGDRATAGDTASSRQGQRRVPAKRTGPAERQLPALCWGPPGPTPQPCGDEGSRGDRGGRRPG